jgi:hypothetical protein
MQTSSTLDGSNPAYRNRVMMLEGAGVTGSRVGHPQSENT